MSCVVIGGDGVVSTSTSDKAEISNGSWEVESVFWQRYHGHDIYDDADDDSVWTNI